VREAKLIESGAYETQHVSFSHRKSESTVRKFSSLPELDFTQSAKDLLQNHRGVTEIDLACDIGLGLA